MGFLGVYRAVYDYAPQSEGELELAEGDLLFVLEKSSEDDWWKAKKRALSDEDDEPEGLVPANYLEEAQPIHPAKALYDYTKQTDEEISFTEEASLYIYDTTDPDWTLVGLDGEYGFAPANYLEKVGEPQSGPSAPSISAVSQRQQLASPEPTPDHDTDNDDPLESPPPNPAQALAGIIQQRTGQQPETRRALASPPLPSRPQYTPEESEEEQAPVMPARPRSQVASPTYAPHAPSRNAEPAGGLASPTYHRGGDYNDEDSAIQSPRGYHLYNVHEMVSHMGKNKKMPTTLGINPSRGLISISPEKSRDGPEQNWTAEKLTHYSIEGKHVFMELVRPSKSIDFHAGAKDTAAEIVAALGELAGASRAEGLREVIAAGSGQSGGQKKGHMLYDFMAQGDDEVTVALGDEVIVLDDAKSEEWWMIRRMKNGKEGVVPSSYVEVTGTMPVRETSSRSGVNAGRSVTEQNRLEEERLTRDMALAQRRKDDEADRRATESGPGARLPERQSSRREEKTASKSAGSKPKPNLARVRTWTDRSGSFKVEAEFIGLKDNKIHLHKLNGVKIAVPVNKMAVEDLEYVEKATGVSLDEDKPLSDIKRRSTLRAKDRDSSAAKRTGSSAGAQVQQGPAYDWFDFFLACGVQPQICERYARAFSNDQMGEEVLPDVTPQLLRTLGLKEGDILRVMKHLDAKYDRTRAVNADGQMAEEAQPAGDSGGLFSGPGGALRNNTRKGRPAPAVQTNDIVDPDAFRQEDKKSTPTDARTGARSTPLTSASARQPTGFDDDAWDVKPSKTSAATTPTSVTASSQVPPPPPEKPLQSAPAGALNELSLLSPPLEPQKTAAPTPAQIPQPTSQPQVAARPTADAAFFDKLGAPAAQNILQAQQTGRPRPMAPLQTGASSMIAPPPRAASAPGFPQQQQPSQFAAPLTPQYTGMPYQQALQTGYQAPPGQSLQDMQRQQQFNQQQMSQQQFQPQQQFTNGIPAQPTGFTQYPQFQPQQQLMNGQTTGSPFADPPRAPFQPQSTGMQSSYSPAPQSQQGFLPPMQPQATGLPPPLTPMRTGMNGFPQPSPMQNGFGQLPQQFPQQTGFGQQMAQQQIQPTGFGAQATGFGQQPGGFVQQQPTGFGQQTQSLPPTPAPLVPQQTGPAPPIRFGVQPTANKLTPQPTGRRANLSNATPQNPFGF